jgi:hypothetical protein
LGYLGSDKTGGAVQDLSALGSLCFIVNPKLGEKDFGVSEIATNVDTRYADKF